MTSRGRPTAWLGVSGLLVAGASAIACSRPKQSIPSPIDTVPPVAVKPPEQIEVAEAIYDDGLKNGWTDVGWATREVLKAGPAKVRFSHQGVWAIEKANLGGDFGGLMFRVHRPPGEGEFLEVRVESSTLNVFPRIKVSPDHCRELEGGWTEVFISMGELDPGSIPFDRVVIRAFRDVGDDWVLLDKIGLTKGTGPARPAASYELKQLRGVTLPIDCSAKATPISPYIYGNAYYAFNDAKAQAAQWLDGATVRRWGGNPTSTYNFDINAWNSGNDWFFENFGASLPTFLSENALHHVESAVTIPIMGWVAKDTSSVSFPVSVYGPQAGADPWHADAGNGKSKDWKDIAPSSPPRAYVALTPAMVKRWVETIGKTNHVYSYILDNEPAIWSTTHRDAHPEPLTYDELVQRSIDYGTAIRQAAPDAVIAGPAEWGWTGYLYSAKDMAQGGPKLRPDRRAHEDLPLVAYYLKAMAEHEKKTGVRVLDVLDLHSYPYGFTQDNRDSDAAEVSALRLRMTRMLWDPSYIDESWVNEPVMILSRMREWIDKYDPGLGISIGEWNFYGEKTAAGGLALAETLGRYAQYGVTSAYYWVYPPENSPGMWAFRAFRDFDGKGGHFLEYFTPARAGGSVSIFASRDITGKHLVVVALNTSPTEAIGATIDLGSCGTVASGLAYAYAGGATGFVAGPPIGASAAAAGKASAVAATFVRALAPYSINVYDIELDNASPVRQ